jgi:rhodanese-related sulfurtransferase
MKRKLIEYLIAFLVIAFWVSLFFLGVENQFNVPSVKAKDFHTFLETRQPIIIDLRESIELQHHPLDYQPTIHLPFLFLEKHLQEVNIPQNVPVLFVCSDGNRARLISALLYKQGYTSYYLRSGLHYQSLKDRRKTELKMKD